MADQQDVAARPVPTFDFGMDFGHERANGVNDPQVPVLGSQLDRTRTAMSGQDRNRACGDLMDVLHKDRALPFEPFHYCSVMDDCAAHIHRVSVPLQGLLDGFNCPLHPGTETARIGQQHAPRAAIDHAGRDGFIADHNKHCHVRRCIGLAALWNMLSR